MVCVAVWPVERLGDSWIGRSTRPELFVQAGRQQTWKTTGVSSARGLIFLLCSALPAEIKCTEQNKKVRARARGGLADGRKRGRLHTTKGSQLSSSLWESVVGHSSTRPDALQHSIRSVCCDFILQGSPVYFCGWFQFSCFNIYRQVFYHARMYVNKWWLQFHYLKGKLKKQSSTSFFLHSFECFKVHNFSANRLRKFEIPCHCLNHTEKKRWKSYPHRTPVERHRPLQHLHKSPV